MPDNSFGYDTLAFIYEPRTWDEIADRVRGENFVAAGKGEHDALDRLWKLITGTPIHGEA